MGKKLALNVFYTVGIFVCLAMAYWGYQHGRYEFILGGIFVAGLIMIFKIKLLRELRTPIK